MLKHELQLQKFSKLKFKTSSKEEYFFPEQFMSEGIKVDKGRVTKTVWSPATPETALPRAW